MDADKTGILIIFFALLGSLIPAFIASSKGRSFFLWYIYGFFLFPFAFIHALVIKPNAQAKGMTKCPNCASVISKEANICPSCRSRLDQGHVETSNATPLKPQEESSFIGERNVSSSSYQLFLTRKYVIEKNATLEKYVIGDNVFDTLEDSLREADRRYTKELTDAWEIEESARRELKLTAEKAVIERANIEAQQAKAHADYLEREKTMAPIRAAQKRKQRKLIIVTAIISIPAISVFTYIKIIERSRLTALKAEEERLLAEAREIAEIQADNQKKLIETTNKVEPALPMPPAGPAKQKKVIGTTNKVEPALPMPPTGPTKQEEVIETTNKQWPNMAHGDPLAETAPQAVALGYKADTTEVDAKKFPRHAAAQNCAKCALFQGKAGDKTGGCPLFASKTVAANGWCSAWAKKA